MDDRTGKSREPVVSVAGLPGSCVIQSHANFFRTWLCSRKFIACLPTTPNQQHP